MVDDIVVLLRQQFGEEWTTNEEANLRFSIEVEQVLRGVDGAHLIGDPEFADGLITLNVWVDFPIDDLMGADQLAFDIFGRIAKSSFSLSASSTPKPFVIHLSPVRTGMDMRARSFWPDLTPRISRIATS